MPPLRRAGHDCTPPCDRRRDAMAAGEFVWIDSLGGYVFPDLKRESDPGVLVRYVYGKIDRHHHGEPYTWSCCPWCGADLVPPDHGEGAE